MTLMILKEMEFDFCRIFVYELMTKSQATYKSIFRHCLGIESQPFLHFLISPTPFTDL